VLTRLVAMIPNLESCNSGELVAISEAPQSKASEWLRHHAEHRVESQLEDIEGSTGSVDRNGYSLGIFSTADRNTDLQATFGHH
jgi:hypothetical protein